MLYSIRLLLPKGDPRLKAPPPGCHVLPATCPTSVPSSTSSGTPHTQTPTPFPTAQPASTLKRTDWAEAIYGSGGDDTFFSDEPVYLGEDNITTPGWLPTESTEEPGGDYESYPAEADSSAISSDSRVDGSTANTSTSSPFPVEADKLFNNNTSEAGTNITTPYSHVDSNTAMPYSSSSTPVITVEGNNTSNGSLLLSGDRGLHVPEKPSRALENESSSMSPEVLEGHTTPLPPGVQTTPHTLDNSVPFIEVLGTTKATVEDPPEFARLETSTETTGAKEEKEENFSNLMKLAPGLPRIFHMLGDLEEEEEAENSMRSRAVHDVIREKRKVDAAQDTPLMQIKTQDKEAKIIGKKSSRNSPILDDQKKEDVTIEKEEAMEVKKISEGKSTGTLQSPNNEEGENYVTIEKKRLMKAEAVKDVLEAKETKEEILKVKELEENSTSSTYAINHEERDNHKEVNNLDKENLPVKRVKRIISDYGGIDVNDAYYLPLYHPSADDLENDLTPHYLDPPPDDILPLDLDAENNADNSTETNSTNIEETEEDFVTRMVLPTVVSYNISTTDRDAFWAQFMKVTAEGGVEATLEPSVVEEESGTVEEGLTDLPEDVEDCFVMVCDGK